MAWWLYLCTRVKGSFVGLLVQGRKPLFLWPWFKNQLTVENLLRASIYLLLGMYIIKLLLIKITYFTMNKALQSQ